MTIDELVEKYGEALREQAAALSALAGAQDDAEIIVSGLLAASDGAEWKAKATAKSHRDYRAACEAMAAARARSETAKAECEYLRTRFEAWRSKSSMAKARISAG